MNIDIQTDHVAMRPTWHRMIDEWTERCARHYPEVVSIDLRLKHGDHRVQYYADKRRNFPPDIEREPGKQYKFRV